MRKTALIVEPYLSGGLLPGAFRRRDIDTIGVHMRPQVGKVAETFIDAEYPNDIVYEGDVGKLRDAIAETFPAADIISVMPGQEAGVELADALAGLYGVRRNDPALSPARRDKYLMHRRIAAAGLRSIRQTKAPDLDGLLGWIEANDCWPAVIKPVNSGGTDGVRFCHGKAEVEEAYAAAIGKTNLLGFLNTHVLAQELIGGTEYIVDTVTSEGRHHVVNIARYDKEVTGYGAPIYRAIYFLDPSEWHEHQAMIDYTFKVLDALGITVGPSHSELFVDAQGPVLVESGARLCGAMVPKYLDEISNVSILDLVMDAYLAPEQFAAAAARPRRYDAQLCAFVLRTGLSGVLKDRPGDELLRGLASFRDVLWYSEAGASIVPTRDLLTGLGMVFLRSDRAGQVDADVARIRRWEEAEMLISV
jgi:biotin carboxylase